MPKNRSASRIVAVIDIDGVMYDFVGAMAEVASQHLKRPLSEFPGALTYNFYKDQWNMTTPEFLDLMAVGAREYGLFGGNTPPYPMAVEGVRRLHALGVPIHFATDCGDDEDSTGARANRLAWLPFIGLDHGAFDITFTADKPSVALPYIEQGYEVFAIDDKVENFQALLDCGANAYLQDLRMNEHFETDRRVSNLLVFADKVAESISAYI
jgi:hypothetical protein